MDKNKTILIRDDYITLGQLLKLAHIIRSGGEEKAFLAMHDIDVNGEKEIRRGRKIRPNDTVKVDGQSYVVCSSNE